MQYDDAFTSVENTFVDLRFGGIYAFPEPVALSQTNSLVSFSRGNSLASDVADVFSGTNDPPSQCHCGGEACEQPYTRQSRHPRIIEPCTKLWRHEFEKKVQIRIPTELQSHVGYGSCKHCYKALVTLVTYIQLQCGFKPRSSGHKFSPPTQQEVARARQIIENFGLATTFYVDTWATAFQGRFTYACGGTHCVKEAMRRFFGVSKMFNDDCHPDDSDDTVLTMLQDEPEPEPGPSDKSEDGTADTADTDDDWLDATVVILQEVTSPRSEPRPNASYIERIQAILENDSNTSAHKLSLCNVVLYECLSKQDKEKALSV